MAGLVLAAAGGAGGTPFGDLLLGGSAGVIIAALINFLANRRKLGAEAAAVLSQAATDLIKPLQDRIHELENDVRRLSAATTRMTADLDACHRAGLEKDRTILTLRARTPKET